MGTGLAAEAGNWYILKHRAKAGSMAVDVTVAVALALGVAVVMCVAVAGTILVMV